MCPIMALPRGGGNGMRRVFRTIGLLVFGALSLALGVFGGYALEFFVPRPDEIGETLNRIAGVKIPLNEITVEPQSPDDPVAFVQTKDNEGTRICRIIDEETLEIECGPWIRD